MCCVIVGDAEVSKDYRTESVVDFETGIKDVVTMTVCHFFPHVFFTYATHVILFAKRHVTAEGAEEINRSDEVKAADLAFFCPRIYEFVS